MTADRSARPRRRWRRLKRTLIGLGVMVFAVVLLGGTLVAFGSEQSPSPGTQAAYARLVAEARQPRIAQRFHIPVPGCVCHSPDPVLQMQHSTRRLSECGSCHGGSAQVR